jgi:hypothetical protein
VAIIVPYRDREDHLRTFLLNIHRFLQRQQNEYGIYIVEQVFVIFFVIESAFLVDLSISSNTLSSPTDHNFDTFV